MAAKLTQPARRIVRAIRLRVKTATRMTLDVELRRVISDFPDGPVVDFGAKHGPYSDLVHRAAPQHWTVDIMHSSRPDVVADLRALPFRSRSIAGAICTQVLEHVADPHAAAAELARVAAPHSRAVVSAPFVYRYHADPDDFFRFTSSGLAHLLHDFEKVRVSAAGARVHAIWDLLVGPRLAVKVAVFPVTWLLARCWPSGTTDPPGFVAVAENRYKAAA